MLLEISCDIEHFENFINKCKSAGLTVDFDIHAADQNSSFRCEGEVPQLNMEIITDTDSVESTEEEPVDENNEP